MSSAQIEFDSLLINVTVICLLLWNCFKEALQQWIWLDLPWL